jgi:hypothetical protein
VARKYLFKPKETVACDGLKVKWLARLLAVWVTVMVVYLAWLHTGVSSDKTKMMLSKVQSAKTMLS